VSSSVKKTYQSVGEGTANSQLDSGEVRYALENSANFSQLAWTTMAAPPPGQPAANGKAAVKVTGADAELEEIVILGKTPQTS